MGTYAMIVVFRSEGDITQAFEDFTGLDHVDYLSDPWEVEDRSEQADYYAEGVLAQRTKDPTFDLPLLDRLRAAGVARAEINYSGSSDEGWIDDVYLYNDQGLLLGKGSERPDKEAEGPQAQLIEPLVYWCLDQLRSHSPGWEDNEGGCGTVDIDIAAGEAHFDHGLYGEAPLVDEPFEVDMT